MTSTVLVTGAAGGIGRHLRAGLAREGRRLRLLDVSPMAPPAPGEDVEVLAGSITDLAAMTEACAGVEAVVHLGGLATGGFTWAEYLAVNVDGTRNVLEAARRQGVGRVVLASSHHVMGRAPLADAPLAEYDYPRPDSFYAVSKVAGEALGRLYHDRHGLDVVCVRVGSFRERPTERRTLWNWLSPGDCTRLFSAALDAPSPGFRVVWGVSANRGRIMSLDEAAALGYTPLDDAGDYEEEVLATPDDADPAQSRLVGGAFTAADFDEP